MLSKTVLSPNDVGIDIKLGYLFCFVLFFQIFSGGDNSDQKKKRVQDGEGVLVDFFARWEDGEKRLWLEWLHFQKKKYTIFS